MTKISTLSDQPFSFSPWNRIFGVKNHMFLSQVKIFVFLQHLQKEWILFYLKWVWNECLHLRTSEMSIDMGRRIVHCLMSSASNFTAVSHIYSNEHWTEQTKYNGSGLWGNGSCVTLELTEHWLTKFSICISGSSSKLHALSMSKDWLFNFAAILTKWDSFETDKMLVGFLLLAAR